MKTFENLLYRYQIPWDKNNITKVFTHNSFSENNNSRYVFLGQFAFKGIVTEWVFNNIAGTGTQLQHYLGNLLSAKRLATFYDNWKIDKIRIAENVSIEEQKHIFVYAILGYIVENATKKNKEKLIFNEFIKNADHLLPQNYKHKNRWDQLLFLCKQQFDSKPRLSKNTDENKINHISVFLNDALLATHSSISFKYAKKKCITEGLKKITDNIALENKEAFMTNEAQVNKKLEEARVQQKQEKQNKHIERTKKHQEKMAEPKRIAKIEAQLQDKKRKETKQKAKEKTSRKGKDTIYRNYTAEEIASMSASKRRNLQDKGIIPKGV